MSPNLHKLESGDGNAASVKRSRKNPLGETEKDRALTVEEKQLQRYREAFDKCEKNASQDIAFYAKKLKENARFARLADFLLYLLIIGTAICAFYRMLSGGGTEGAGDGWLLLIGVLTISTLGLKAWTGRAIFTPAVCSWRMLRK